MAFRRRILVIDEDAAFRRYASHVLGAMNFEVIEATSGRAGLDQIRQWMPDCIIVDLDLQDIPGIDAVRSIQVQPAPRPPVVATSANLSVATAVAAMKAGAKDAVEKPISTERLKQVVKTAIDDSDLAKDMAQIDAVIPAGIGEDVLTSDTPQMRALIDRVDRLASVEMPVLVIGEPGTGASALARRLHASGPRRERPFVEVPELESAQAVEAVLFGSNGRPSAFAQAQDGTLFIQSIVALGAAGQDRLRRVLEEVRDARASGQSVSCPRIVVGCDKDISVEVASGRVREDLAHRLSPLTVNVPPLRERRRDIPKLVEQIVGRAAAAFGRPGLSVSDDVMQHLTERDWPENIDELHGAIVRGVVLARDGRIRMEDVVGPTDASSRAAQSPMGGDGWHPTLDDSGIVRRFDDYEAEIFRYALDKAGGCVSRAAETLGVGRATMYRKMRSYDIDAPPVSERAIIRTGRRSKRKKDVDTKAAA